MYIKPENRGKFTATKKATGKSTSELLHSKNAKTRSRANFARMAKRGFKKLESGGTVEDPNKPYNLDKKGKWSPTVWNGDMYTSMIRNGVINPDTLSQKQFSKYSEDQVTKLVNDNPDFLRVQKGTSSTNNWGKTFLAKDGYTRPPKLVPTPLKSGNSLQRYETDWMPGQEGSGNITKVGSKMYFPPNDEYSLGGWLKENVGDIAKTAAGVGAMFIPGAQGVGAGLIAGGVGGMVSGEGNQNEVSEVYKPAVSKSRQIYDKVIAEGGTNLKRLSRRTDYKGEDHSQGGINLPIGAQVETGESRTGDIVHSDKIKITPAIMKRYGGNVPLRKGDLGRSVADVVKSRDKRFEKRSGDEWNDQARKVSQMPFEDMSNELSQIYDIAKEMSVDFVPDNVKAGGGHLGKLKARKMLHDGKVRGKPLTDKQRGYFGAVASGKNYYPGGGDIMKFLGDEGNAPIIGSAVGLVTNLLRKPEKVKYDQASFTPTTVTPISTEAGINRIKRSFGSSRERLRRLNPRGYMNNLTNMAASEAETIGDYTGQVQGQNADVSNRASMIDSQNRSRTSMFNSQISMQEAEANAANRGMRRTAIDANMNNLFTQIGQKSKDEKMMKAQEDYQNKMFELQKGYQDIWKDSIDKGSSGIDIPNVNFLEGLNTDDYNTQSDYKKRQGFAGGGSLINKTTALLGKRRYRTY